MYLLNLFYFQMIISVSQLIGAADVGLSNSRFTDSLSVINSYANNDKAMQVWPCSFFNTWSLTNRVGTGGRNIFSPPHMWHCFWTKSSLKHGLIPCFVPGLCPAGLSMQTAVLLPMCDMAVDEAICLPPPHLVDLLPPLLFMHAYMASICLSALFGLYFCLACTLC